MKRPYLVCFPEGATRTADFVFMHKNGGACFVDIGWDVEGRHPFHIIDGPISRTENQWQSSNGTIIRELTVDDQEEWRNWQAWMDYKASPEGRGATDEVAIAACKRDGALFESIESSETIKPKDNKAGTMTIGFNTILKEASLNLTDVRLLRHKDKRASKGRTPYELWRDNRQQFELYQSTQSFENRNKLRAAYWASFVVSPNDETMFVGLYSVKYKGVLQQDTPMPHMDGTDKAGSCDVYDLTLENALSDLIGRLIIDWGAGERAWIQRADRQNKQVGQLRRQFKEPEFPGFLNFIEPLSKIEKLPTSWVTALRSTKGIYLLTCPKTKEQYVGSATGENGFWQRWQDYVQNGHGGKTKKGQGSTIDKIKVYGTLSGEVAGKNRRGKPWRDRCVSNSLELITMLPPGETRRRISSKAAGTGKNFSTIFNPRWSGTRRLSTRTAS